VRTVREGKKRERRGKGQDAPSQNYWIRVCAFNDKIVLVTLISSTCRYYNVEKSLLPCFNVPVSHRHDSIVPCHKPLVSPVLQAVFPLYFCHRTFSFFFELANFF